MSGWAISTIIKVISERNAFKDCPKIKKNLKI